MPVPVSDTEYESTDDPVYDEDEVDDILAVYEFVDVFLTKLSVDVCVEVGLTLLVILPDLLILPVTLCVGEAEEVLEVVDDPDIVAVRYIVALVRLVREELLRLVPDLD